jgi:hypothetical protein
VAAARLPVELAGAAELRLELLEQVLPAGEAVAHDARADIAGDDGLDGPVRDAVAVRPAAKVGAFDSDH